MTASSLQFRRSPSNKLVSSSKCVFQFRENVPTEDPEAGWKSIVFDGNYRVKEETFAIGFIPADNNVTDDVKIKPDEPDATIVTKDTHIQVRSSPYHLLRQEDDTKRGEASSAVFMRTVSQVLSATRVLCFS